MSSDPRFYTNPTQLAQVFGFDRETFHREVKDDILDWVPADIKKEFKKVENLDIGIDKDGFIWVSLPKNSKSAKKTNLTVEMFKKDIEEEE